MPDQYRNWHANIKPAESTSTSFRPDLSTLSRKIAAHTRLPTWYRSTVWRRRILRSSPSRPHPFHANQMKPTAMYTVLCHSTTPNGNNTRHHDHGKASASFTTASTTHSNPAS